MPYIIQNEKIDIAIYVILFPFEQSCYIWKSPVRTLKNTYIRHFTGNSSKTKSVFEKAKKENIVPPLYILESLKTTHEEAFLHCIAWANYFSENGYTILTGEPVEPYIGKMREDAEKIYKTICNKTISEICPQGEDLFPDYGKKRRLKKEDKFSFKKTISFPVSNEEYEKIQRKATANNMSVSKYCRDMINKGKVIKIDIDVIKEFTDYINQFANRDSLLKQVLAVIYSNGNYYPADLTIIQNAIDENGEQQNIALKKLTKIFKMISK